jgi:hypothetical protein
MDATDPRGARIRSLEFVEETPDPAAGPSGSSHKNVRLYENDNNDVAFTAGGRRAVPPRGPSRIRRT